jgi:hypothetical protein
MPGDATSEAVELTSVSAHAVWLLVGGEEVCVPFAEFPWLRDATIAQLANVRHPSRDHLYWPDLDVDLSIESIRHPERFPLKSRANENDER